MRCLGARRKVDLSMTMTPRLTILAALLLLVATSSSVAKAQQQVNGPTALIISYHAKPQSRAAFRSIMKTEGIPQLNLWKQQDVFASYTALFTTYAADTSPDMFLILRFNHFTDLGRWQTIEESYPGGLTKNAQTLAEADVSATADIVNEGRSHSSTADSQFVVVEYDVTTEMPNYVSYVQGYVAPQFKAWVKNGALSSFVCYTNQNSAGAPWSSFIVLEYKDLKALADREEIKTSARAQLAASDPIWKKWSENKSAIRREKGVFPALALR